MANYLAKPHDLYQPILNVSSEALMLPWWSGRPFETYDRRNIFVTGGELELDVVFVAGSSWNGRDRSMASGMFEVA